MRRQKMSRRSSRKQFRRGVQKQHPKNRRDRYYIRGGGRL